MVGPVSTHRDLRRTASRARRRVLRRRSGSSHFAANGKLIPSGWEAFEFGDLSGAQPRSWTAHLSTTKELQEAARAGLSQLPMTEEQRNVARGVDFELLGDTALVLRSPLSNRGLTHAARERADGKGRDSRRRVTSVPVLSGGTLSFRGGPEQSGPFDVTAQESMVGIR